MKKQRLLILFLALSLSCFAQDYIPIDKIALQCYYQYSFQQDSTNAYSVKTQEMCLQIGSKYSKFTAYNNLTHDSIAETFKDLPMQQAVQSTLDATAGNVTHSYCKAYIYKNYPGPDTLTFRSYLARTAPEVIEVNPFKWTIKFDQDSTILSYSCKKALCHYAGRDYVAWFSPEIPVSEGPFKFYGLPGLILQIADTKGQHTFTITEITKGNGSQPILLKKSEKTPTKMKPKEYVQALNTRMAQLFNKIKLEDGITFPSEEARVAAMKKMKTRNNYIELY